MAKRIIADCSLIDLAKSRWVYGELWKESGCYIFHACTSRGETAWQYDSFPTDAKKIIRVSSTNARGTYELFDKQGVIVFYALRGDFNQAAIDYLK